MNLLNAALHYAENGIPVFPVHGIDRQGMCTCQTPNCPHPGKHPIFKGGFKIATTHQQQITQWWTKHPDANIGVPTGALSGWYVVDVDQKNRGIYNYRRFNEQHANNLPPANLKVRTGGGGCHLIYGQPSDGQAVGSGTNIGRLQSVNFRGDGGYIVVPPSSHVSGRNYRWEDNYAFKDSEDLARLQPLPAILVDVVNPYARTYSQVAQESVNEGGRNNYLFKKACQFRKNGVNDEELLAVVYAENQSACRPPLDSTEVEQIVASALKINMNSAISEPDSSQKHIRRRFPHEAQNQSLKTNSAKGTDKKEDEDDPYSLLMKLTAGHEYWTDSFKKQYVTFPVANKVADDPLNPATQQIPTEHYENWPIQSREYGLFLGLQYRLNYQKHVPRKVLENVLSSLAGDALFFGESYPTHVRTARSGNSVIIDLTDDNWNVIKITASGWSLWEGKPTVKFVRTSNVQPMPIPDPSGDFNSLRQVFRLKSESDYLLLAAWLMYALVENGPYPILAVEGVAGSSKSMLTKHIRQLVDPRLPVIQGMPRNLDDLSISAHNSHLIAIDNLSKINQELSNVLCGIATGMGFGKRELYSDSHEVFYEVCRPIIFNGINSVIDFSDLADRSIRLSLPQITSANSQGDMRNEASLPYHNQGRLSAEAVEAQFQHWRPKIMGAIFTAIGEALPKYHHIKNVPAEIRMMGFAQWAVAAGNKLAPGNPDFLAAFMENRCHSAYPLLEDSILNASLFKFIQLKKNWSGTPTELFNELRERVSSDEEKDKSFPKRANQMTKELNKAITTLKQFGINYIPPDSNNHKARIIKLSYTPTLSESNDPLIVDDILVDDLTGAQDRANDIDTGEESVSPNNVLDEPEQKNRRESKLRGCTNRTRHTSGVRRVRPGQSA